MKVEIPRKQAIQLHVGPEGTVWTSVPGSSRPRDTGSGVIDFVAGPALDGVSHAGVVGLRSNAELVVAAYERLTLSGGTLLLYGPRLLAGYSGNPVMDLTRPGPALVLAALATAARRDRTARSFDCGPHRVGTVEAASYRVAAAHAMPPDDEYYLTNLVYAAVAHPLVKALSFLDLELVPLARLISWVLDPRWYVDRERPEHLGRLRHNFLRMFKGSTSERYRTTVNVWKDVPDVKPDRPSGYFHRVRERKLASGCSPEYADLRVASLFVRTMRGIWMNLIYAGICRRPPGERPVYQPELALKDPRDADVLAEFLRHEGRLT